MRQFVGELAKNSRFVGKSGIDIGVGISTGEQFCSAMSAAVGAKI